MRASQPRSKKTTRDGDAADVSFRHTARDRRGRRPTRLAGGLAAGAAALILAGCEPAGGKVVHVVAPAASAPAPSPSAVASGRYVQIVAMSGLQVSPPPLTTTTEHLGLTWSQAATLFEATSAVQGSHAHAIFGYGLATLEGSRRPAGTPPLRRRGAWVGITWGGTTHCPAETTKPGSASTSSGSRRQIYTSVVIYGDHGDGAIVYTSRGAPPCGGPMQGPTVEAAKEVLSVPWQQKTPVHAGAIGISYRAPACATLFSTAGHGNLHTGQFSLDVEVTVPFDHAACRIATRATTIRLFPSLTPPGAPAAPSHVALSHQATGPVAVLEAGRVGGAPGGSAAHASSSAASAGSASIGTLGGVVETVGGPAPGSPHPVRATVIVRGAGRSVVEVSTAPDGAFSIDLPAGTYQVTARSPRYQDGRGVCHPGSASTIGVQPGRTTKVRITCEER